MDAYDALYRLYAEYDTAELRAYRDFVDLFPPLDSRVALERWEEATEELNQRRAAIEAGFADASIDGVVLADVAARADRETAFGAQDLRAKYGRAVNAFVLDVDETLRSAGDTDNEIPRETLHLLTEFHEDGVPIIVCTGQTLENVKGFLVQGLGNELVHSGDLSVVYEAGAGVFTPGRGPETKQLLYEDLDRTTQDVFETLRARVLRDAPETVRQGCHLQGNEFNVTLKPNAETGSDAAATVIDEGLGWLLDLLGEATVAALDGHDVPDDGSLWARAFYADADPEIATALADTNSDPVSSERAVADIPEEVRQLFERIDVGYYPADAAEVTSRELDKPRGVEAALEALAVSDPFVLVMGDSKSDLRVMEWAVERDAGIAAAPAHASTRVLEHVRAGDDLVFTPGDAAAILRMTYALNRLATLETDSG